jgi:hypothetical protein
MISGSPRQSSVKVFDKKTFVISFLTTFQEKSGIFRVGQRGDF